MIKVVFIVQAEEIQSAKKILSFFFFFNVEENKISTRCKSMMQHGRNVRSEETVWFMMNSLSTESTWGVLGLTNISQYFKLDRKGGRQ